MTPGSIATFNVDHKSSKELRQYLANIADQCESTKAGELPAVIILDNLHHVTSLGEVFNGFLTVKYQKWSVLSTILLLPLLSKCSFVPKVGYDFVFDIVNLQSQL